VEDEGGTGVSPVNKNLQGGTGDSPVNKNLQGGTGDSPVNPLSGIGAPPVMKPIGEIIQRHGAHLPHWTAENAIYHVIFRLADSLPQEVLWKFEQERELLLKQPSLTPEDRKRLKYLVSERIEAYLDSGYGSSLMKSPEIADCVQEIITFHDGNHFQLHAWCIMPNHVHLVIEPNKGIELSSIMQNIKSVSSHRINELLSNRGTVWQKEPYDHIVRNEASYCTLINYVVNNPVKAKLIGWKWVFPGVR
jgi:REP element-mobilizing transposase RayT